MSGSPMPRSHVGSELHSSKPAISDSRPIGIVLELFTAAWSYGVDWLTEMFGFREGGSREL